MKLTNTDGLRCKSPQFCFFIFDYHCKTLNIWHGGIKISINNNASTLKSTANAIDPSWNDHRYSYLHPRFTF